MSQQFKRGDVCVIVRTLLNHEFLGSECTIEKVCMFGYEAKSQRENYTRFAFGFQLRLKRPPEEPKSDFTPCEDDFTEWFNNVRSAEKCR